MEKKEVLGYFDYKRNGKICVKIGSNMRFGSEAVTYIHELYHERLSHCSILGIFLNFIGMAWTIVEKEDESLLDSYGDVLVKYTRKIQEVYASSMTWLWLQQKGHEEYKERYISLESEEYRKYRKVLKDITDNVEITLEERERLVDSICRYALNVNLDDEKFWNCIVNVDEFDSYIGSVVNPQNRMEYAYQQTMIEKWSMNEEEIDEILFLEKLCSVDMFKKMGRYIALLKEQLKEIQIDSSILEEYKLLREKKIKVFDFSSFKVVRGKHSIRTDIDTVCIIKRCNALEDKKNNYYIIKHSKYKGESVYLSQEIDNVENIVAEHNFIIIPLHEYDMSNWKPKYFETNKPIFVLVDNYDECMKLGKELLDEGELYWGDMYSKERNNFFTVNFFVRRGKKNIIFVFPTTKKLALILQRELEIEKQVLYSNQDEFFKIFGTFHDGANIFKAYRDFMAFILDSTGSFLEDEALKLMSLDATNTIINAGFNLATPTDYFEQMMYFPTKQTVGNGKVWILMRFKDGERIGDIKVETIKITSDMTGTEELGGILVFDDKENALKYIKKNKGIEYFYPVEVDKIFWEYFKPRFKSSRWNLFLCNGENYVQIIDIERLEYMLYAT